MTMRAWMQEQRRTLLIGVPLFFCCMFAIVYIFTARFVSTDDAYVQAGKAAISANVPGQVIHIYVRDNERVKQGTPLFSLDPRPYQIALENAEAKLITARLHVESLKATYRQNYAHMVAAYETYVYKRQEFERQQKLAASLISSDMQLNTATNEFNTAEQQWRASQGQLTAVLRDLNNNPEIVIEDHPTVQQAEADVDHAKLNLEYTRIVAPFDGIATKVELLQVGDYVRAGQAAFALMSQDNIWVEANYKETEITHIRPGQFAVIKVDAYPGKKLLGKVQSMSPGTGSSFALLPPENATGNWVKIVQRVPVRIVLLNDQNDDEEEPIALDAGLSVTVTVDTKSDVSESKGKAT